MRAPGTLCTCVLLLGLGAAGCGSSGHSGLTRAQLIKRGDAICKRHTEVITAGATKLLAGGKLPTPAKFGRFAFGTIIPQYSAQIDQLAALKPPASIKSPYERWLADSRATLARVRANPVIIQSRSQFTALNHEGDSLGFSSDCHAGPGG